MKKLLVGDPRHRLGSSERGLGGPEDIQKQDWFQAHGFSFDQYTVKAMEAPWVPPLSGGEDTSMFSAARFTKV